MLLVLAVAHSFLSTDFPKHSALVGKPTAPSFQLERRPEGALQIIDYTPAELLIHQLAEDP